MKYSILLSLTAYVIVLTVISLIASADLLGTTVLAMESIQLGIFITGYSHLIFTTLHIGLINHCIANFTKTMI